jgi:hypothetical protein
MTKTRNLTLALLLILAAVPALAQDIDWGIRTGYYFDVGDPFLGVEALMPISGEVFFNPNIEWVFIDGGDLATINIDIHYDFRTPGNYFLWAGLGLAGIYSNLGDSDFDLGANLLAGVGWRLGTWLPYAQLKGIIADNNDVVLALGVRF